MALPTISDGEAGSSVRAKLNSRILGDNNYWATDYVTLVGDGVTDNRQALAFDLGAALKVLGPSYPATVTISIASPSVISWTDHRLQVNDVVRFTTTGALPTGIVAGTPYYVLSAGKGLNSFRISPTNADTNFGEGSAVNTSGSQSGVHSARAYGVEWKNVIYPPGSYYASAHVWLARDGGRRLRHFMHGFQGNDVQIGNGNYGNWFTVPPDNGGRWAKIASAAAYTNTVTLLDISRASRFYVGCWLYIAALDMQNGDGLQLSTPNNTHYFEFVKVSAIDAGTGVITLASKLRNSYKSTYPEMWAGSGDATPPGGGPATIFVMHPAWDSEVEVHGLHHIRPINEGLGLGRSIKYVDCRYSQRGHIPSMNKSCVYENCEWEGIGGDCEVDKQIEYLRFTNCTLPILNIQSSSVDRLEVEGGVFEQITGTPKNTHIRNADIGRLIMGIGIGASESLLVENSRIGSLGADEQLQSNYQADFLKYPHRASRWTFSAGKLQMPKANYVGLFAVPGRKVYVNDLAGAHRNMGSPFTILDVYEDGTDIVWDTTLTAMPVGNGTSATVTMTIASPAVVTWNSHGLAAGTPICFKTTGALPTGITATTVAGAGATYYVSLTDLATNTFKFSATNGGAEINTSGSQSGTHTCESNPLHFQPQSVQNVTFRGVTGCPEVVDLSMAPDGQPPFSYLKRTVVGGLHTAFYQQYLRAPTLMGNVVQIRANVIRAYTGALGTLTAEITSKAFEALLRSDLSQTINLKIAGERIVTPDGVTGVQDGDILAATNVWLSDTFRITYSDINFGDTAEKWPILEVEVITDQGVTKPGVMHMVANGATNPSFLADTTVMAP